MSNYWLRFAFCLVGSPAAFLPGQTCTTAITGTAVPALASIEPQIQSALQQNSVKGGAVAVSYNGRLIYARGFGCADTDSNKPMRPDSPLRVASVSKTFTSVAILQLVERGKLSLDSKVFGPAGILSDFQPAPGKTINPDLLAITVRHLLLHAGGWDRNTTQHFNGVAYSEPVDGIAGAAAAALGDPQPGTDSDVIRVMLSQPIQHTPGTFFSYSNFGYVLLGRVIEKVSGLGYEQYVQQNILKPAGIGRQKLGAGLMSDVVNGEATYYDAPDAALVRSVYPQTATLVPRPYGGKLLENVDSAGEWVTDVVDLCRFVDSIDGRRGTALLTPATIQQMTANPNFANEPGSYYGLGFLITPFTTGLRWTKGGDLPGTASLIMHAPTGFTVALVFNGNPAYDANNDASGNFESAIGITVLNAANALGSAVPSGDQYPSFSSTLLTPVISAVGDGATFQPAIVAGSWVSITGQNLATATRIWMDREFTGPVLPLEVDHVLVTIDGKPAPIYYVSPTQLNVEAPAITTTGSVTVQVIRDGTASAPFQVRVADAAPGFFTYVANGKQYLAAVHVNGVVIGDVVGTLPAKPGETVELYATGLGPSLAGTIPSAPMALTSLPVVTIGGLSAPVSYAGLVSPGLFQINAVIPQVSAGLQTATVRFAGQTSPSGTVIAIGN